MTTSRTTSSWGAFLFADGATVTHVYAWSTRQRRWKSPCNMIAVESARVTTTPTMPLCKVCGSLTATLRPNATYPGGWR